MLKNERRFVCHDKQKRPINPLTGSLAKVTDSSTWASFAEAIACIGKYKAIGIGFVLGEGFLGVDLDTCINRETNQISEEAAQIISTLDSYTEVSLSGTGTHTIVKAKDLLLPFHKKKMKPNGIIRHEIDLATGLPKLDKHGHPKCKEPEFEIYNKDRYFILTGKVYGGFSLVNERTEQVKQVIAAYNHISVSERHNCSLASTNTSIDEAL